MHVREQTRPLERTGGRDAIAAVTQSGSEVEHQRFFSGHDETHARRVSAVTPGVIAMARCRTANPKERDNDVVDPLDDVNAK
jgi:hypothetical protein